MAKNNQQNKVQAQPTEAEVMMQANNVNEIWKVGSMWYVTSTAAIRASDRTGIKVEYFSK